MLKPSLCDYSDAYILVSRTKIVAEAEANDAAKAPGRNNKQAILKNCAPFNDSITQINNL